MNKICNGLSLSCGALFLLFASACTSQGYIFKSIPDPDPQTNRYSITGIKARMDDPLYAALHDAYERCGGKQEGDKFEINFKTSSAFPGWSEAQGWQYLDLECLDAESEATR